MEHLNQTGMENSMELTCIIPEDEVISLLELLLKNCVFFFQEKFYQQLQGAAMGSLYLHSLPTFT